MKLIIKFFIYLFHLIYNYRTSLYFSKKFNSLYSVWLSFDIKHAKKVRFAYPINLIGGKHITIGENTSFGKFCILSAWDRYAGETFSPELKIGSRCRYNHITTNTRVEIGDNVIIGANSVVTHDVPSNSIAAGSPAKVINHISC